MARDVLASGAQWSDDGDLLPENSNLTEVSRRLRSETIVVNATGQSEPAPPAAAEDRRGLYSVLSLPPLNRTVMRKQVLASDAPQDLAARPGGDPSRKQSGGRAVNHPIAAGRTHSSPWQLVSLVVCSLFVPNSAKESNCGKWC